MLDLETLKKELNPQQYRAVTTTDGAILIIAGAGSGKHVSLPLELPICLIKEFLKVKFLPLLLQIKPQKKCLTA